MARHERDPQPAEWPAPRGPREWSTGKWRYLWATRPEDSYRLGEPEEEVVAAWKPIVDRLIEERYAEGWSLRQLAKNAGVSLSTLLDMEQGNAWPRVATVEKVAAALGFHLEVESEPGHEFREGVRRAVRRKRVDGMTPRQVAEYAGLRPSTYYDLPSTVAGGSVLTLLCLAHQAGTTIALVPSGPRAEAG